MNDQWGKALNVVNCLLTADCDDDAAEVKAYIIGPSSEDLLVRKEGWVQCKFNGDTADVTKEGIEWRKDGKPTVWNEQEGLLEVSGSITIKLKIKFEEWQNGTEFSCFIPHKKVPSGLTKSYKRETGKLNICSLHYVI